MPFLLNGMEKPCFCFKTDERITIDGDPAESAWKRAVEISLSDSGNFLYRSTAGMLWNDRYLYLFFRFSDPDIRVSGVFTTADVPSCMMKNLPDPDAWIKETDPCAHFSLSPNAEHTLKFWINPLNTLYSCKVENGISKEWRCDGIQCAVRVCRTVNATEDIDCGWSVEIAIPWKSLQPFMDGKKALTESAPWKVSLIRMIRNAPGEDGARQHWQSWDLRFRDDLKKFERFFDWSLPDTEEEIRLAAETGVTDAVISLKLSRVQLETAAKYGILLYPVVVPWIWDNLENYLLQKMLPEEEELQRSYLDCSHIAALKHARGGEPGFRYSGDPKKEVYLYNALIICFGSGKSREWVKQQIRKACSIPGSAGIAFNGVGFLNYHGCYCPGCREKYAEYRKLMGGEVTEKEFYLRQLVDFNNANIEFIKEINPKLLTFCHIWPVYRPEPLYGHRMKFDWCAETAAWYTIWEPAKIRDYTEKIIRYPAGVPFIGYYDAARGFQYKTPEKVDLELRTILDTGGKTVSVCGLDHVLRNESVRQVFRNLMKKEN